jgi:septal ring factor EnvC (AmiA/AmiB activator)
MSNSRITQLAKEMYDLRTQESELSEQLKNLKKKIDGIEEQLITEMTHEELQRVDLAGKASFHIATKKFFKIANRQDLLDFLHQNGDEDIITVNHQTLNAYAKEVLERKEAAGIDDFEIPGVTFISKPEIRVRKVNK